jgi:hypothetical protein
MSLNSVSSLSRVHGSLDTGCFNFSAKAPSLLRSSDFRPLFLMEEGRDPYPSHRSSGYRIPRHLGLRKQQPAPYPIEKPKEPGRMSRTKTPIQSSLPDAASLPLESPCSRKQNQHCEDCRSPSTISGNGMLRAPTDGPYQRN